MKITVNYFGQLGTAMGTASEAVEYVGEMGITDLLDDIIQRHGEGVRRFILDDAGELRRSLLITVNNETVEKDVPRSLNDGDEIALLPPIAGG